MVLIPAGSPLVKVLAAAPAAGVKEAGGRWLSAELPESAKGVKRGFQPGEPPGNPRASRSSKRKRSVSRSGPR